MLLGAATPIVLGPFGGVSSVELTAAVSELGGLGSFGLYGYEPDRIRETIAEIRARTAKPFAVNVWLEKGDEVTPADVDVHALTAPLQPFFNELGVDPPASPERFLPTSDEQIEAVLDEAPAVLSFVFGVPSPAVVESARDREVQLVGTATTVAEALALEASGVDAIVATGFEAGGHRVSFIADTERSLVGTFSLVPQVVDAVSVPVIAAGGIADRRGVAAAFALGAQGVQVGTAFLRTSESAAAPSYKERLRGAHPHDTVLTRAMSGRFARGIPNRAIEEIEASGEIGPFPAQNWITGRFRAEAARVNNADLLSLWAGQSAALAKGESAAEVFAELSAGLTPAERLPAAE